MRNPHLHGTLAIHQLFSEVPGARSLFGVVSSNCPMPLSWSQEWDLGFLSACLARDAFPAAPLQASHEGDGWVSSELLFHAQSCFPTSKSSSLD